jgi:hypothetical protein
MPWIRRQIINCSRVRANPLKTDMHRNPQMLAMKTCLRPNRCAIHAAGAVMIAEAIT